jgi:hypothetical protein
MPLTDQLPPWLAAAKPDVVLMHLGTNDMWGGYIPLADKLSAFTKLVGQMRAANPAMKIVVAQTGGFQDEVAIRNSSSSPPPAGPRPSPSPPASRSPRPGTPPRLRPAPQ